MQTGNSDIMMVNPNEIVIDMPVDERNIAQKMESMKGSGIIQPVTLWLHNMSVIDGFHRTVAAQRLGWKEIPCYVVDCSEDAFWDARIQSAKQHHAIEDKRLRSWVFESWKMTHWHNPQYSDIQTASAFEENSEVISMMEMLYDIYRRNPEAQLIGYWSERERTKARSLNPELYDWLQYKASLWGVGVEYIIRSILKPVEEKIGSGLLIDGAARRNDLSLLEKKIVTDNVEKVGTYAPPGTTIAEKFAYLDDWINSEVKGKKQTIVELPEFSKAKRDSTQGQIDSVQRNLSRVRDAADRAVWAIQSSGSLLIDNQDFAAIIAETIATLTNFHNEHFKRKDAKLNDLLASRNAKLRREVKALTEKLASLERALSTKQAVTPRLKDVMVEHSQ